MAKMEKTATYMLPLLLLLLVMVWCPVVSAFPPPNPASTSHHSHHKHTRGESGKACTRIHRQCLKGVQCVHKECVCPSGTKGNGLIECVNKDDLLCMVTADPHLNNYQHAHVDVDLPCRYRLTRYVTSHRHAATPHAFCSVEVYATNELNLAQYYVRSVHISLGITDSGKQVHDQFEVKKFGVSDDQIFKFLANITQTRTVWGFSLHEKINGVDVYPTFDVDNNFAVLAVPECGTKVKYRAYDRSRHRQPQLPGVTIRAPSDIKFVKNYGFYPHSLCGTNEDDAHLYDRRAEELGLKHRNLAVIFDILHEAPPQHANPKGQECENAFEIFKTSKNKVADLNFCGDILTNARTRKCIVHAKADPITVFNKCLQLRQHGSADDCSFFKNLLQACGRGWRGPKVDC
uniref:Capsule gland specific secretory protein n=1 Tax=Reishia bronni TaxID=578817 RepID=A0A6G9KRN5_9CAEN|nr:capsule gland specific secretory protein [Reishia bronni]